MIQILYFGSSLVEFAVMSSLVFSDKYIDRDESLIAQFFKFWHLNKGVQIFACLNSTQILLQLCASLFGAGL